MCRQTYVEKSKAPLLVHTGSDDPFFAADFIKTTDEKFAKFEPEYKRTHWDGVVHGFATRGDPVCFRVLVLDCIDPHSTSFHIDK